MQVQRDHTCISLHLKGRNNSHMCDKCQQFQMRLDDDSGRRPAKNATPKCEKPWIIQSGINSQTKYQTVKKKRKFIVILTLYNYTVVDA